MTASRFRHFLAIDWSGAAGERHKGIALAMCDSAGGPPRLMSGAKPWSRAEVLHLLCTGLPSDTLVGMDLGMSLPFEDAGAFFPGWSESPPDAPSLWRLVDEICAADPYLGAGSFVDHPVASRYFRRQGGREGDRFELPAAPARRGRFRVTERAQAAMGCRPYSNFNLVGAAQVGKSSLTGMRLLHSLRGGMPIWPVDPLPSSGSVLTEIYTAIAALAAGRTPGRSKMTTQEEMTAALHALGSPAPGGTGSIDDHSADALVTSAWLRMAATRDALWQPAGLSLHIARTEGWTFGAV